MDFSEIIHDMKNLERDWDGYNAPAISPDVIERALHLNSILNRCDFVSPTPRNTIQFEYHIGEKYIEVEVYDKKYEIMIVESKKYDNVKYYTVFNDVYIPTILRNFLETNKL